MAFHTPSWELALFRWINDGWRCPVLDMAMPLISSPAFLWALALFGAAVLAVRRGPVLSAVLCLGLSVGLSDLATSAIKDSAQRVRPYHQLELTWYVDSDAWVQRPPGYASAKHGGSSYPSAHAANAAAAAAVLFLLFRARIVWLIPLCVGVSRVYLGKHYPLDVVSGWCTGLAVAAVVLPLCAIFLGTVGARWQEYRQRK